MIYKRNSTGYCLAGFAVGSGALFPRYTGESTASVIAVLKYMKRSAQKSNDGGGGETSSYQRPLRPDLCVQSFYVFRTITRVFDPGDLICITFNVTKLVSTRIIEEKCRGGFFSTKCVLNK